jgi:phosphatidate phosphatase APP1
MTGIKEILTHLVDDTETHFDNLKYRLMYALGGPGPVKIVPYRGYGSHLKVFLKGRVLEKKGIPPAEVDDSVWENLINTFKRMESDEIPYARLKAEFYGQEKEIEADEEGMFDVEFNTPADIPKNQLWHPIKLTLLAPDVTHHEGVVRAEGEVLIPSENADFGVISDIDDTVLQTGATHMVQMARNVFLRNARARLPFPGVAAFYRALLMGSQDREINPLFYVSSSPWNLYDLLVEFFHLQSIPLGPVLFLRNWGISEDEILPLKHRDHKFGVIEKIMDMYPHLPFILIGDSGQEDPEIYYDVAQKYPDRVQAIYIRNVSRDMKRPETIRELAKKSIEIGSTLILADETLTLAEHAVEKGWISPAALPDVKDEKEKDEAPPTKLEKLLGETEKEEGPTVSLEVEGAAEEQDAKEAIDEGVIEDTMEEAGDKDTQDTPKVVIEPKDQKNKTNR